MYGNGDDPSRIVSDRRRRFLRMMGITGVGGVLAGCLGGGDDANGDDENGVENGDDNGDDDPNGNGDEVLGGDYEPPDESEWPPRVDPGSDGIGRDPPADATILWDGETATLDDWEHSGVGPLGHEEDGADAEWNEEGEYFEIESGTGDLRTKEALGDCHLHLEWRVPEEVDGESPVNGNSGLFMMERYEIQIVNSYDGGAGAGAYYATEPPLANPCRPAGEWNEFDVVWRGPRFDENNELLRYPMVTVFFNGVVTKAHFNVPGPNWAGIWDFDDDQHGHHTDEDGNFVEEAPFYLQDHQEELDIAQYRNVWYRDLPERPVEIDDPDALSTYDTSYGESPEQIDAGGPGTTGDAPEDADVLVDDPITIEPGDGDVESEDSYGDCQIHVEWRVPEDVEARGPYRGDSGVVMLGEYEIQILDNADNPTEADEWAGAYVDQEPPHHDAVRDRGEWQHLDIVWQGPRFEDGDVQPAQVTALLNGVVVQDRLVVDGPNADGDLGDYEQHANELPLRLPEADTEIEFRNAWARSLD